MTQNENNFDYEYEEHSTIDHRIAGLELLMGVFSTNTSSPRLDMLSKHISQAMCLKGADFPFLFSGNEKTIGEYEYSTCDRQQDVEILSVIPKYLFTAGHSSETPEFTVICRGLQDKKIDYFTVSKYTKGTDGYGYYNKLMNQHMLQPGTYLNKDVKLSTSPIHKGNQYCLGINANAVYMTMPGTVEDAFTISQSMADKMGTTSIRTMTIQIFPNQHPLNLYGDENEIKFMPDIGEKVRDDGILAGFRTPTDSTFMSDTLPNKLGEPNYLHDKLFRAPPGSTILDINCYMNKANAPAHLWTQVDKYINASVNYYKQIIDVYNSVKGEAISGAFNTLVSGAMSKLLAAGYKTRGIKSRSKVSLAQKESRIEFLQVEITYAHTLKVSNGFKITGRDGHKGVLCQILPDEDMPVDEHGFQADIVIDPLAVNNRMNIGQLYEVYINRISEFVRRSIEAEPEYGWQYLLDYLHTINPLYAKVVNEVHPTDEHKRTYVDYTIKNGVYINIPFALDTITLDLMELLDERYGAQMTPVSYNIVDKHGNKKRVTSKCKAGIGSKYIYLLYKIPEDSAAGICYINQFQIPIAPSKISRLTHPISQTPNRMGEDEFRILSATADMAAVMRLSCIQANSLPGVHKLAETLLTEQCPTRIGKAPISDKELKDNNPVLGILHHALSTAGIDSYNTEASEDDEQNIEILKGV